MVELRLEGHKDASYPEDYRRTDQATGSKCKASEARKSSARMSYPRKEAWVAGV